MANYYIHGKQLQIVDNAKYLGLRPKQNICVFTVTRPTLIFASDSMNFYTEFG